jgi:hypothetical protein
MGANIYPEDAEALICRDARLAAYVHSFCLCVVTDKRGNPRPGIALELETGATDGPDWPERIAIQLRDGLAEMDLDVRSAMMAPTAVPCRI